MSVSAAEFRYSGGVDGPRGPDGGFFFGFFFFMTHRPWWEGEGVSVVEDVLRLMMDPAAGPKNGRV